MCLNLVCRRGSHCVGSTTGEESGRGWGGCLGNFTRGLPHDVCFKYAFICFFLSVQENIQQKDHELLLLTGFSY